MSRLAELQSIASRRHGLVTRPDLLLLGFTARQISRRTVAGDWRRLAPGVYDVMPGAPDPLRPLHATVLATRGWASHRSASALHRLLPDPSWPRPEVVASPSCDVRAVAAPDGLDAIVHRSRRLPDEDRTEVEGIPCTSVRRTLLDLAAVAPPPVLEYAVGQALASATTTVHELVEYLASGLDGRAGVTKLRAMLGRGDEQHAGVQRRLNDVVLHAARAGLVPPPVQSHTVTLGGRPMALDLAWPDELVFVEAESAPAFTELEMRQARARDADRQLLVRIGWLPLRFGWEVAYRAPFVVIEQVRTALDGRAATGRLG